MQFGRQLEEQRGGVVLLAGLEVEALVADGGDRERRVARAGQSGSEEFRGLRGYVPGDSLSQVDWKGYARGRGLNVKLFEEPASGRLWLRYDRTDELPLEQRLSILCYSSLMQGVLSGMVNSPTQIPEGRRRTRIPLTCALCVLYSLEYTHNKLLFCGLICHQALKKWNHNARTLPSF